MDKLPRVIATSVVRSAHQGESHGGVYLIDLNSGQYDQVIDWNDESINWEGRGGDRGLRGIAFHNNQVFLAASDEIFVYDTAFNRLNSYGNQYLQRCHEISSDENTLYLTSTDLNSVLEFDLTTNVFSRGYTISRDKKVMGSLFRRIANPASAAFQITFFDPNNTNGPRVGPDSGSLHINNVSQHDGLITISGTAIESLLELKQKTLLEYAPLPRRTHNAAIYKDGIIYNDTGSNRLVIADRKNRINLSMFLNTNRRRYRTRICQTITLGRGSPGASVYMATMWLSAVHPHPPFPPTAWPQEGGLAALTFQKISATAFMASKSGQDKSHVIMRTFSVDLRVADFS